MNRIFEKHKILLIDDEEDILDILETVLKREGFKQIYTANTGKAALEILKKVKPDIILLDIMLPDTTGYELFKELRDKSQAPILFISAKGDEVDRLLGFAIGADDYITKPFSAKEVAFRVKARLKAIENLVVGVEKEKSIIKFGDLEIHKDTGEVFKSGESIEFTAKEFKLLNYLIDNPNRILSKEMMCREVWGEDFFGYDNTITVHIRKLRKKIEDNPSKPKYIVTAIGLGYKFINKGSNK
ncbi:response regulator transcription factor [uncultured Clostridium sp.]|uniref:response regulator transcription factor n=1 Tax=uncultured Clostridium sp. TaxID=59620 RepID=UPI00262AA906|nr:response regulator transcription factor [uncultured Clostridium sp.]